jgi:hypothetical protein
MTGETPPAAILSVDFEHFRAIRPRRGYWRLVVDEIRYDDATRRL